MAINFNFGSGGAGGGGSSGANGAIQFSGGSSNFSSDENNFFWDNTNKHLGLGTNNPNWALEVAGSASSGSQVISSQYDDGGFGPEISVHKARGSVASPTPVTSGTVLGQVNFGGQSTTTPGTRVVGAQIQAQAAENFSASAGGTNLLFYTTPNGFTTPFLRMRFFENGDTQMNGVFNNTTGAAANMVIDSGTAIVRRSTSSARYKEDIDYNSINPNVIRDLKPASWKDKNSKEEFIGFIAEDVDKTEPRLVTYDKHGRPDALHYGQITAVNTRAIQMLLDKIDELESKISLL